MVVLAVQKDGEPRVVAKHKFAPEQRVGPLDLQLDISADGAVAASWALAEEGSVLAALPTDEPVVIPSHADAVLMASGTHGEPVVFSHLQA